MMIHKGFLPQEMRLSALKLFLGCNFHKTTRNKKAKETYCEVCGSAYSVRHCLNDKKGDGCSPWDRGKLAIFMIVLYRTHLTRFWHSLALFIAWLFAINITWLLLGQVNLTYQDQLEQEKADARNAVEEYVYGIREKLYELDEYITEKDKTAFSELLTNMENWLYDEGEDQPKKVYVEKLEVLKKSGDPVVHRQKEFLQRPTAFEELAKVIIHYEKILQSYSEGVSSRLGDFNREMISYYHA